MNTPEREIIDLDKLHLSMLRAGPPGGSPVLLVHGIPTGAELWRDVIVRLAEAGYRVYAADMPGYGRTRYRNGGDYSLAGAAEAINQWMTVCGLPAADIVAHDIGGGALQILATRYPKRISRMVFSNTIVGDSWPVAPIRIFRMIAKMGLFGVVAALGLYKVDPYMNHQLRRTFANPDLAADPDYRNRIFFDEKMTTSQGRKAFSAHLKTLDNNQTIAVEQALSQLDVPVMLLWGRQDPFQPWEGPGKRLNRIFPEAEVRMIDKAGHFLMLDQPEAYSGALIDWLNRGKRA